MTLQEQFDDLHDEFLMLERTLELEPDHADVSKMVARVNKLVEELARVEKKISLAESPATFGNFSVVKDAPLAEHGINMIDIARKLRVDMESVVEIKVTPDLADKYAANKYNIVKMGMGEVDLYNIIMSYEIKGLEVTEFHKGQLAKKDGALGRRYQLYKQWVKFQHKKLNINGGL